MIVHKRQTTPEIDPTAQAAAIVPLDFLIDQVDRIFERALNGRPQQPAPVFVSEPALVTK